MDGYRFDKGVRQRHGRTGVGKRVAKWFKYNTHTQNLKINVKYSIHTAMELGIINCRHAGFLSLY